MRKTFVLTLMAAVAPLVLGSCVKSKVRDLGSDLNKVPVVDKNGHQVSSYDGAMNLTYVYSAQPSSLLTAIKACEEMNAEDVTYRIPDVEEVRAALENGLMDETINHDFAHTLSSFKPVWTNDSKSQGADSYYVTVNLTNRQETAQQFQVTNDVLCVAQGHLEPWNGWLLLRPKSQHFQALERCTQAGGHLETPEIIVDAVKAGLANPAKNPKFGYILSKMKFVWSSKTQQAGAATKVAVVDVTDRSGTLPDANTPDSEFRTVLCHLDSAGTSSH